MDVIDKINKEFPTWVAQKQLKAPPCETERQLNGRKQNANSVSLEAAAIRSITTAQA